MIIQTQTCHAIITDKRDIVIIIILLIIIIIIIIGTWAFISFNFEQRRLQSSNMANVLKRKIRRKVLNSRRIRMRQWWRHVKIKLFKITPALICKEVIVKSKCNLKIECIVMGDQLYPLCQSKGGH